MSGDTPSLGHPPQANQLHCPSCNQLLRFSSHAVPEGPCPSCGYFIRTGDSPAMVLRDEIPATPDPVPDDAPGGGTKRPATRTWRPEIQTDSPPRPGLFRSFLGLADRLESPGGQVVACATLATMLVISVALFMKLDEKHTAEIIAHANIPAVATPPAAPLRAAPTALAGNQTSGIPDKVGPAPLEPSAFGLETDGFGGLIKEAAPGSPAGALSMDDADERR